MGNPVRILLIWNLQVAPLLLTNLEKYLSSGSFLNFILKLIAMIILVKYRAAVIIYHPIITERLRFLHQSIEHTQIIFLLILCFHGVYSILGTVIILRSQQQNNGQNAVVLTDPLDIVIMAYFTFKGLHVKQYQKKKPYKRIWVDQ